MSDNSLILLIIILMPLAMSLANGFLLRKAPIKIVGTLATLAVFVPFVLAVRLFLGPLHANKNIYLNLFPWFVIPHQEKFFHLNFGFILDHLSGLFLLIITGVGSLIHLYSTEYMVAEKGPYRFFVYLNLFIFSMLCLVLGSNMVVTFLGWEGVGVCSYLLIGYWYDSHENSLAAIKAFIFNRVGDVGFLLAMFFCYKYFHTLNYAHLSAKIAVSFPLAVSGNQILFTLIGLCLLLAVCGKSAQIPLYTWLPDAMAGPTPVSALIHAATMVTAGIYLMNRTSFLLVHSPVVMHTIAIIGAATAFLSATIGFAQNDIKKVLAYSTCSQLGYMVMACGVGAFQYGVAHVMTHAFFKACLFLGAGSVIHALHHEQDIRKMGGLWKRMPVTFMTFVMATLAIMGFPGFSGFFSKDAILAAAMFGPYGHPALWFMGTLTAGLTAFYMWRLTWLVFLAPPQTEHIQHVKENKFAITLPLVLLAILSVFGGAVSIPAVFTGHSDFISMYLTPVLAPAMSVLKNAGQHITPTRAQELKLMNISVFVGFISAALAIGIYRKGIDGAKKLVSFIAPVHHFVRGKWYVDEFYHLILVNPLAKFARKLYSAVDRLVIEGLVNGIPRTLYLSTALASDSQVGQARNYLKLIFVTLIVVGLYLLLRI